MKHDYSCSPYILNNTIMYSMKINLNDINYYFLTYNNLIRKQHILNEFAGYNLIEVNPIPDIGKYKSGASGFIKISDLACQNQDRNMPFQPFVIFEDDAKKHREFPSNIDIPDDADILYIGISRCGMRKTTAKNDVRFININEDVIRIYNMLSSHGILICSMRGLLMIQKCMLEGYYKNNSWDIYTAQIQPYLNVYALKNPLVYQYEKIGGIEEHTKLTYMNMENREMPSAWINKTNDSIVTSHLQN